MRIKRLIKPEIGDQPALPIPQRNQKLDRQIDEMIAKGIKLIGPFKTRYEERQK